MVVKLYKFQDENEDIFALEYKEVEKERSKICFLSGRERKVLSGGHSRLDCEFHRERRDVGPGSYRTEKLTSALNQTLDKVTSKVGYGGLASRAPRFCEERKDSYSAFVPTPFHKKCLLHVPKVRVGKAPKSVAPFGSNVPRKTAVGGQEDETPGFYYDVTGARKHEMPFDHSFGGRTRLKPHVFVKCVPDNLDVCSRCDTKPLGDYWHFRSDFLCRPCYDVEWNKPTKYSRKQLEAFKKIRDCSFAHRHEGTTAAYPLLTNREIWRQRVLECYFACYEGPRKVVNAEPRGQARQSRCQDTELGRGRPKSSVQVLFKNPKNKALVGL
uniref:Uncharacterized protein n=1 Tax=Graphocephala atropunctata TaxID=36148 RepID=A0A1B6LN21_9HEMI